MPVSMVCDSTMVSAAIRDSLTTSSTSDANNIDNQLNSGVKRVLLNKIEYEEVPGYSKVIDNLKSKYIVLKASNNTNGVNSKQSENTPNHNTNGTSTKDSQLPAPKRILYPRDNVQIGWKSSGRKWYVGSGMTNVGNTCYLNSTLQAVFHVPAVANWLISDAAHREKCEDNKNGQGGCIICAMANTLIATQSNHQSAIKPFLVYSKLKLVCKHLLPGRQEDAHEFLRYLVEAMEKSYLTRFKNSKDFDQYIKETTPLNQILGGYLRSDVKCLHCHHVSTTFQHFEDILLDIRKANSIEEALELYFARERLEENGYKCEACMKKVAATKQFSLERAPIAMCIQLKRFSHFGGKLNKHVELKQRLDLSLFSSSKNPNIKLNYKLVSMVTHLGATQHCGHYTAIGFTDAGGYYQFDDSSVRPISPQNVLNTNAYILFYELEDPAMQNNGTKQTSTATSATVSNSNKNISTCNGVNGSSSTNNSTPLRIFSNNNSNPSTPSKLENKQSFIGPLLPSTPEKEKKLTNGFNHTNGSSTSITLSTPSPAKAPTSNGITQQNSKLVNNILSKSKLLQNKEDNKQSPNKIVINLSSKQNGETSKLNGNSPSMMKTQNFDKKHVLPSMPKLSNELSSISTNGGASSSSAASIASSPSSSKQVKSLVPYESDDDSDDESSSSLSPASSNPEKSPTVIQTKAGIWKVSDNSSSPPPPPIATTTTTTTSHHNNCNNNNNNNHYNNNQQIKDKDTKYSETVNHLLKMSHRGYGAPVISWNGQKTNMEKEIIDEKRDERKRQIEDDRDTEMDRGRSKKMKIHYNNPNKEMNNYNAFQDYQNVHNSNGGINNRNTNWMNSNHNKNHNKFFNGNNNNNNNSYRNNYNNNHYRNHNNNFRGRHRGNFNGRNNHHHHHGGYYNNR